MFNTAKVSIYFQTSKPKVLKILKQPNFLAKRFGYLEKSCNFAAELQQNE